MRLVLSSRFPPASSIPEQATSLGLGEPLTWGQVVEDARGEGDATLFLRLCKRSHLAVANTGGVVSGPNPSVCRRGVARGGGGGRLAEGLRGEKPPLRGSVSPSWGRRGGEKGSWGGWVRPGGALLQASEGRMPQDRGGSLGRRTPPPRLFPPPATSPARRRRRRAPGDLSQRVTEEEDRFPTSRRS